MKREQKTGLGSRSSILSFLTRRRTKNGGVLHLIGLGVVWAALSAQTAQAQLSSRLIGWWRMDDTNATAFVDASGYGRNATFGKGVSVVDGRFGKAARFDGTGNAWASFASPQLTNLTLAAWVYVDGLPTNIFPRIMQIGGDYYYHMPSNMFGCFNFGKSSGSMLDWQSTGTSPFKFVSNRWFHAAVVYQTLYTSETARVVWPTFYINGVRCGTSGTRTATTNIIPAGVAYLGNSGGAGTSRPLSGMLDDVRLYNAPLSDKDILALYQNGAIDVDAGKGLTCYRSEATLQGRLVNANNFMHSFTANAVWSVVSTPSGATPVIQMPWLPATSVTLPANGTYTFRLTASNEFGVASDDVSFVRHEESEPNDNAAPVVSPLWSSTNTVLGTGVQLAAAVTDDGKPSQSPRVCWRKTSGPGAVFFNNAFTNNTDAYFSTNGTYVLTLEADDGARTQSASVTVSVSLSANTLSDGLLHWWRMDQDPDSAKVYDSAGTNTLTLMNQAILQPGKTGFALRTPQDAACAKAANVFTNAETMTFAAWIYYDNAWTNNPYMRIINSDQFYILYNRLGNQLDVSTRGAGTGTTNYTWSLQVPVLTSNQWIHIALLFDRRAAAGGSKQTFYLNGLRYQSGAFYSTPTGATAFPGAANFAADLLIGGNGGNRNFDGVIDELRVYNRFLTDDEVRLLATDPDNNHAPVIEGLPAALTAKVGRPVALGGTLTDDGQPSGASPSAVWSVASGNAGHVMFDDASSPAATVTFTHTGDYALLLSASDGEQPTAVRLAVTVIPTGTLLSIN